MSKRISLDDIGFLTENWPVIRKSINNIVRKKIKDTKNIRSLIPLDFDESLILGAGMWGLVIGLPNMKEIIVKLTTDPFEYHLTNIITQDKILNKHPAIPYTLGTGSLNIKNKNFPLYLIVRENLQVGVHLSVTNPLKRMEKILIEDFIWPVQEIEKNIASSISKRNGQALSLLDISLIHSLVSGEIGNQIIKIKSKLPKPIKRSKFNNVLDLQKKLLDYGIAFVDITENNLGTRIPGNLSKIFKDVGKRDLENIVVSDLGMAYGTPIFFDSDMGYKDLDEMIDHILGIFGDYGDEETTRQNPAPYLVSDLIEDMVDSCHVANLVLSNVLLNKDSQVIIDKAVAKIMDILPSSRLSSSSVSFLIKNKLISVIKHWIDPLCVFDFDNYQIYVRCYIDFIDDKFAGCRIFRELSLSDESPIGLFEIPFDSDIAQVLVDHFTQDKTNQKQDVSHDFRISLDYISAMNGIPFIPRMSSQLKKV